VNFSNKLQIYQTAETNCCIVHALFPCLVCNNIMKGQHFIVPGGMICIYFLNSYTDVAQVKVKLCLYMPWRHVGEWWYSSTCSQLQHLIQSCHLHAMVALFLLSIEGGARWTLGPIWMPLKRNVSYPVLGIRPHFLGVPTCSLASTLSMQSWLLHKSRTSGIILWYP